MSLALSRLSNDSLQNKWGCGRKEPQINCKFKAQVSDAVDLADATHEFSGRSPSAGGEMWGNLARWVYGREI